MSSSYLSKTGWLHLDDLVNTIQHAQGATCVPVYQQGRHIVNTLYCTSCASRRGLWVVHLDEFYPRASRVLLAELFCYLNDVFFHSAHISTIVIYNSRNYSRVIEPFQSHYKEANLVQKTPLEGWRACPAGLHRS